MRWRGSVWWQARVFALAVTVSAALAVAGLVLSTRRLGGHLGAG